MGLSIRVRCSTLNRPAYIERFRESLAEQVLRTGDRLVLDIQEETEPRALTVMQNEGLAACEEDVIFLISDYMMFEKDCLLTVMEAFRRHFPALDGVIGVNMVNRPDQGDLTKFSCLAIGKQMIAQSDVGLYNPEYYHFYADTELGMWARSVGKFQYESLAHLWSFNPQYEGCADDTSRASRQHFGRDKGIFDERQRRDWLWPRDRELVKGKGEW